MTTVNPFDLLGEVDDTEDPSQLIAVLQQKKIEPKKALAASAKPAGIQAKLPSKPLPPSQAVREAKSEFTQGGRGGGRGYGRGRGSYKDSPPSENSYGYGNREFTGSRGAIEESGTGKPFERRGSYGGPRGPFREDRRGGFSNGEDEQRRPFDRRSGTGRGNEIKREGGGQGNWGYQTDELASVPEEVVGEGEKSLNPEKPAGEVDAIGKDKEAATKEVEEKEPEEKEMTLDEYEKVLEEKRKALETLKTEQRKVDVKQFEAFQQLANKKTNDEIFVKLGSEKDKKKELAEKEEKAKKSVSINEFLKPSEGQRYNNPGGRGRGRGSRGGYSGGHETSNVKAPSIEDPGQFPTLGGK